MRELRRRGFIVTDGPFSFNEIAKIAKDYDHSFAVTPDVQIKRGRTSTRWGGGKDQVSRPIGSPNRNDQNGFGYPDRPRRK